jgi:two-component system, OmpR family, KDP operon response regulator KdpE
VKLTPTVLLVDDEPSVLEALQPALEGRGYHVQTTVSGRQAMHMIAAEVPDVVVLDLGLPDLDGVEVCRKVRAWSDVPIIVLSARSREREKVEALDAGADDFVIKPFGLEELLARIRAALRREGARKSKAIRVVAGSLTVDLEARRVARDGKEIHLTPTEYALLETLAGYPGRVMTQRHLLLAALGPGYEDALENLRTFVGQLRRKIEPDPSRPRVIRTVPGIGYQFTTDIEEST